nr:MAG TPA: hypothetical protein [Caudoviricetes sp.]
MGHNLTRRARKRGYGRTTDATHQRKRSNHAATRHQRPQERRKPHAHEITYQKTKRRTRPPEPPHGNKEKPRHNGQGKEEPRKPSGLRGLCSPDDPIAIESIIPEANRVIFRGGVGVVSGFTPVAAGNLFAGFGVVNGDRRLRVRCIVIGCGLCLGEGSGKFEIPRAGVVVDAIFCHCQNLLKI